MNSILNSGRSLTIIALWVVVLSFFILSSSDAARNQQLPLTEIREFARVLEIIQQHYVDDTEDTELIREAIRGMLRDLDPYSSYLDKRQKSELKIRTQGQFGGLGIHVSYDKDAVKVIAPIDGTPAQKAGIEALDRIIKIDGESTATMDLEQAVDRMRGKPGSSITLIIRRKDVKEELTFTLVREVIKISSINLTPIKDGYVYTRISNFQSSTASDLSRHLRERDLLPVRGIILDLRNNPGGLLSAAIEVSDIFIRDGIIVSTQGRTEKSRFVAHANGDDITQNAQLVVLINSGSASASEIVAGALQDHDRALVVGIKSFGKGTVQSVFDISPEASIKLTTARYMTPKGRFIHEQGIEPDILVDLPHRTTNASVSEKEMEAQGFTKDAQAIFSNDPQLWESYNILERLTSVGSVAAVKKGT